MADEPLSQLAAWEGGYDFFATGAPLATDSDNDGKADTLLASATVSVTTDDITEGSSPIAAYLYWGGSILDSGCQNGFEDDEVEFAPPGADPIPVTADACFCSDAGAMSYDMQLCRAEVTALVDELIGDYSVAGLDVFIDNGDTHTASFSVVLVYANEFLRARRIGLYDGLQTLWINDVNQTEITLDGLDVDPTPEGDLTWYVLEGDVGGSMEEQVALEGSPGGLQLTLQDALNPSDNPMNGTINTSTPPHQDAVGVDIDQFDIKDALSPADTALKVTYTAGLDKYWVAYNIVGVNVYQAVLLNSSSKTWTLHEDADNDGTPTPGDTVRYTIHLENTGTADADAAINDAIPAEAASWMLVDAGGGTDLSTPDALVVQDLALPQDAATDIVLDVVIADVPEGTEMINVAQFDAGPDGDQGELIADPVVIGGAIETSDGTSGSDSDGDPTTSSTSGSSGSDSGTSAGPTGDETTTDDSGDTGGTNPGGTDSAATTFGETGDDGGGCGCTHRRPSGALGSLALALLVLVRRRRRGQP